MIEESLFKKPSILPSAESLELAPIETTLAEEDLQLQAIRRQKVRELRDMGYNSLEIYKVIKKGIVINDKPYFTDVIVNTIKSDLAYLLQEDLAADKSFPERKAEIISKYELLYRQAMHDYATTKGQSRVSFLNAAKTILDKLTELKGVAAPKVSFEKKIIEHTKASALAKDIKEGETSDESGRVVTTIDKILRGRQRGGAEGATVASEAPRVRTPSSKDGDIPN